MGQMRTIQMTMLPFDVCDCEFGKNISNKKKRFLYLTVLISNKKKSDLKDLIKAHLTSNGRLYIPIWNQTYGFNVNARQYTRFHTQAHTKYINHHRISGERKNSVKKMCATTNDDVFYCQLKPI